MAFAQRDLVIYEMHVRGFTRHESSNIESRGTYLGVVEKLDHLKVHSECTLPCMFPFNIFMHYYLFHVLGLVFLKRKDIMQYRYLSELP